MADRRTIPSRWITWLSACLGAVVVIVVVVPWFLHDTAVPDVVTMRFLPPLVHDARGMMHWLGTDRLGRDVAMRLLLGARVSITVGLLTMLLSLGIGLAVGAAAGMGTRVVTAALLAVIDFALGVPRVVLLLLLAAVWSPSALQVIVVLALTGWMPIARLVYSEIRGQQGRPYVDGAFGLGATRLRVFWRHMLPHAAPPVAAAVTLGIANAITLEAGLSFLGLGVQPPTPSWGSLIASGRDTVVNAPWVGLAPGIALVLVVALLSLLADALVERGQSA